MGIKYKLRNGDLVERLSSAGNTFAIRHEGVRKYLLPSAMDSDTYPTGGVLGDAFDIVDVTQDAFPRFGTAAAMSAPYDGSVLTKELLDKAMTKINRTTGVHPASYSLDIGSSRDASFDFAIRSSRNNRIDALNYAQTVTRTLRVPPTTTQSTTGVNLMSNESNFKSVDYYGGQDVTSMSDEQIFRFVKDIDAQLKDLKGLDAESAAVKAHTKRLNGDREKLMAAVDKKYKDDKS